MKQVNRHIISSLNWNTSFDRKEKATELQSRLSTWSNIRLQRELNDLFDSMCPPGQTWRIGSIELDLGTIGYDQLEPELSLRIRKQLTEKLTDMIRYPEKNGGTDFEILDEDASRLDLIESFLLTGVIPWNGSLEQESADRLMAHQLKHNKAAIIEMLWEVGSGRDHVRKRMAWQFSDATVIRIVEGLEPGNHQSIVGFADHVTELQRKEPVVPGSAADLRKNIWHWVLNYLYNEHGTVFNRIAFMKSTIRQMAAHHNVSYDELMALIEEAVNRIKKKSGALADFVHTLDLLSEENKAAQEKVQDLTEKNVDHWQRLEAFLRNPSLRSSTAHRAELNDLVVNLGRKDKQRLAGIIRSALSDESTRMSAVADLGEFSLEVIFSALLPAASAVLLSTMEFLQAIGKEMKTAQENKILWNTALKFAIENRNAATDRKAFIAYCLAEITSATGIPAAEIVNNLLSVRISSALKTTASLEVYSDLLAFCLLEEKNVKHSSHLEQFRKLLDALCGRTGEYTTEREAFLSLRASLIRKIKLYPEIALEALIAYPHKNELDSILPFITGDAITELLIRNSKPEMQNILDQVKQAVASLAGNGSAGAEITNLFSRHLYGWALEALIMKRVTDPARLLESILEELTRESGTAYSAQFALLTTALAVQGNSVVKSIAEKMLAHQEETAKLPLDVRIKQLMSRGNETRRSVGKILIAHFSDTAFIAWRKAGSTEGADVLNFLLPDGEQWRKKFISGYKAVLLAQKIAGEKELTERLQEIYWKCILDYEVHRGNIAVLRKSLHAAVLHAFSSVEKEIRFISPEQAMTFTSAEQVINFIAAEEEIISTAEEKSSQKNKKQQKKSNAATEKVYILKSGAVITLRELFELIAVAFENGNAEPHSNGMRYELKELLDLGLELKPAEIRKIIASTPLTEARLKLLKTVSSFSELSMWIMSDLRGEMNSAMEAMRVLHNLIALMVPGATADKFLDAFWTEAWAVVTAGKWSQNDLKKLIRTSFTKMAVELDVSAAEFITEMKSKNIRMTPFLRDSLIACFPAFAALPESERETSAGRQLAGFESRGLLDSLVEHIVVYKRIPLWLGDSDEQEVKTLLHEIIIHYPVKFLQVMKHETISETQMRWLSETISFKELIASIGDLNRERRSTLHILEEFYSALGKATISGVSAGVLREILFRKLIKAWTNNNWKIVSTEQIWNELVWDVCLKYSVPKLDFLKAMEKSSAIFPPAIKIALDNVTGNETKTRRTPVTKPPVKKKKPAGEKVEFMKIAPAGIAVRNAGVVLLSSYVQMLFERLGLARHGKFINDQAQNDAVHYLQYVITGHSSTEESFLPLNKVLCGLPVSHPVSDGITITDEQKKLIDGLIKAAISHWPVIGDTSIDGFRGNWLVRDGMLTEYDDKWNLVVEKRAYDLLLSKSPYSFSIVRYPWMDKSLHVTWPY